MEFDFNRTTRYGLLNYLTSITCRHTKTVRRRQKIAFARLKRQRRPRTISAYRRRRGRRGRRSKRRSTTTTNQAINDDDNDDDDR